MIANQPKPSAPKTNHHQYSDKIPVPELNRDPFETFEEFAERINNYPPIPAGKVKLIKKEYSFHIGEFLIQMNWDTWTKNIKEMPSIKQNYCIHVPPDIAQQLYQSNEPQTLFIKLKSAKDHSTLDRIELFWNDQIIPIQQYTGIMKPFKNESETDYQKRISSINDIQMGDIFDEGYVLFFGNNEKPVHDVKLDSFYIAKYPVTQGQWEKVMHNNPSCFKEGDNYPVENLSWNDTQEFIKKLNEMNKDTQYEFRLPTEAEWEYAARSGGKKEKYAGGDHIDDFAWYSKNSNSTHPVGEKMPNGLGLYDMSGIVWEWCEDNYSKKAYSKHTKENPVFLESKAGSRVLRGGAWSDDASHCRAAYRSWNEPSYRYSLIGFRLVSSPRSVN